MGLFPEKDTLSVGIWEKQVEDGLNNSYASKTNQQNLKAVHIKALILSLLSDYESRNEVFLSVMFIYISVPFPYKLLN